MSLKLEHEKREKLIFDFLNKVVLDCSIVYLKENEKFSLPMRIQLITSFSLLDVLASFYYEYNDLPSSTQQRRFIAWVNKYALINSNKEFNQNKTWSKITADSLYSLRSSLVHFFGVSAKSGDAYISIANNHIDNIAKIENEFLKRGAKTIIFRPHDLHELVKQGGIAMLQEWMQVLNENKKNISENNPHIKGIERLMNKIDLDGGFPV